MIGGRQGEGQPHDLTPQIRSCSGPFRLPSGGRFTERAVLKILHAPDLRGRLEAQGDFIVGSTPEALGEKLAQDIARATARSCAAATSPPIEL